MAEETSSPPAPVTGLEEAEFDSVYANNARMELSVWDLKMFFGQLEQHTGKATINWHTAVTMPWIQAKILLYFLRANIAFQEIHTGRINIPDSIVPPLFDSPTDEAVAADPKAMEFYEACKKLREEMFG